MDDRRPRAPQPRRNSDQVVKPSITCRINKPRRAFPPFRGRWPRLSHAGRIEKRSAGRSRPSKPTRVRGCPSACENAAPGAARSRPAAPLQPRDRRVPADPCARVSAPSGETLSTGSAPASRLDHSRYGRWARRLGFAARKFGPSLAHCGDQFRTSALGDAPTQRGGQLLLFLQRKPVGGVEHARVSGHTRIFCHTAAFFNSSVCP